MGYQTRVLLKTRVSHFDAAFATPWQATNTKLSANFPEPLRTFQTTSLGFN
jgi:hypothetical protein